MPDIYSLDTYEGCYSFIKSNLKDMGFRYTLDYINNLHERIRKGGTVNEDDRKFLFQTMKTEFLVKTNGDVEAYKIIQDAFWGFIRSLMEKRPKCKFELPFTHREAISEENVGSIEKDFESVTGKIDNDKDIRRKLLLLNLIIQHSIIFECTDKYFELFLRRKNITANDRFIMINKYLKYKELRKNSHDRDIADYTFFRHQIAHGNFALKTDNIVLYIQGDPENMEEYPYSHLSDMYNAIVAKWRYVKLLYAMIFYLHYLDEYINR